MSEYFDEQLLSNFTNTFYGYGDYQGTYWFIGMEEGGGNSYEEINNRLTVWDRHGRRELEPLHTFHQDICMGEYFQMPPKRQPTWNKLIRVLLSATAPDWDSKTAQLQGKAVQDYQIHKFGHIPGQDCLIELFPLPSPSTNHWIYADHISKLSQLKDRKSYRKHYLPMRVPHIKERIHQYNPAVVVFYGLSYRRYWEQIVENSFSYDPTHGIYILQKNATLFIIIAHPARRPDYAYFHTVGQLVASCLNNPE